MKLPDPANRGRLRTLFRLTVCLVMLHGCNLVSSQETSGGYRETDAAERIEERADGIARAVDMDVAIVVKGDDRDVGSDGKDPRKSVRGDGKATEVVDEGTGEVVDDTGEALADVGECSGRRFKKCR